jgi:hypothetical protein
LGVFWKDLASGKSRLIHQKGAKQDIFLTLQVWPWSPDDRFFIYSAEDLTVCAAASGKDVATFPTEGRDNVAGVLWLKSDQFVYVNKEGLLHWVQHRDGKWQQRQVWGGTRVGTQSLTALSKDTIAWQKGNRNWFLNLADNLSGILFDLKNGKLNSFDYSPTTGQFLLDGSEKGNDYLWQSKLTNGSIADLTVLAKEPSIHHAVWLNAKKGACAFLSSDPQHPDWNLLMVKSDADNAPVQVTGAENISAVTVSPDRDKLMLVGVVSNELAAGIWNYSSSNRTLNSIVPCTDKPTPVAKSVEPMHGVLHVAGRSLDYYVYPPAGFDRHSSKKYPVVLGNTLYHAVDPVYQNQREGPTWAPALAQCGVYVVIIERPDFWFNHIDQWPENILAMYQKLTRDPTIDDHQVYLFATSAETPYLDRIAEKHPNLWAGLMVFNGSPPSLSHFVGDEFAPRLLLTAGVYENREDSLTNYQKDALAHGIAADVVIHPDSAHVLMGKEPLTQKSEAMNQFIFNE